jgi:hypothetical protein
MNHIYRYQARDGQQILPVMKWLRRNGQLNEHYVIHQANYRFLLVEFLDKKLELMYTMQYSWTNE